MFGKRDVRVGCHVVVDVAIIIAGRASPAASGTTKAPKFIAAAHRGSDHRVSVCFRRQMCVHVGIVGVRMVWGVKGRKRYRKTFVRAARLARPSDSEALRSTAHTAEFDRPRGAASLASLRGNGPR